MRGQRFRRHAQAHQAHQPGEGRYRVGQVGSPAYGGGAQSQLQRLKMAGDNARNGGGDCGHPPPRGQPGCDSTGVEYCFTQVSGEQLNVAAPAGVIVTVTPTNMTLAVPRSLLISVFDVGVQTRVQNGGLTRAEVFGDNQLGNGVAVPLDRFSLDMPYLAENWRPFTPVNPYLLTIVAVAVANVDIRVTMDIDGIKGPVY